VKPASDQSVQVGKAVDVEALHESRSGDRKCGEHEVDFSVATRLLENDEHLAHLGECARVANDPSTDCSRCIHQSPFALPPPAAPAEASGMISWTLALVRPRVRGGQAGCDVDLGFDVEV